MSSTADIIKAIAASKLSNRKLLFSSVTDSPRSTRPCGIAFILSSISLADRAPEARAGCDPGEEGVMSSFLLVVIYTKNKAPLDCGDVCSGRGGSCERFDYGRSELYRTG